MSDVKSIAKQILDGSYDQKSENDWINTIVYRHLPDGEKANFRAKCLKHIPIDILEQKALKIKIEEEKQVQQEEKKKAIIKERMEVARKPSWILRHKQNLELISVSNGKGRRNDTTNFALKPTPAESYIDVSDDSVSNDASESVGQTSFRAQTLFNFDAEVPTEFSMANSE